MATPPIPKSKLPTPKSTPPVPPFVQPEEPPKVTKPSRPRVRIEPEPDPGEFYNVIHPCSACQFCVRKEDKKNLTDVQGVCVWHSVEMRLSDMELVSSEIRQKCLLSGDKFVPRMTRVDPITYAYWMQGGGTMGAMYRTKFIRIQAWATLANLLLLFWLLIASFIK